MKQLLLSFLFFVPSMSFASQVAECHGSDIFGNPTIAQVFADGEANKIFITTSIDTIESRTKIDGLNTDTLTVYDNDFQMYFTVSLGHPESPVQAFRDGAFFVEDFECIRVSN